MLLDRNHCAGLIIDIQEKLLPHIARHVQVLDKTSRLIRGLQVLSIPALTTQQYTRGLGETVPVLKELLSEFNPIEKISFSCCGNNDFNRALETTGRSTVLIAGIESHVCVQQTALELKNAGYRPVIIADCTGSRDPYDKEIALQRMMNAGCIITTCEAVLFELCRKAGTEEFKEISKIVK